MFRLPSLPIVYSSDYFASSMRTHKPNNLRSFFFKRHLTSKKKEKKTTGYMNWCWYIQRQVETKHEGRQNLNKKNNNKKSILEVLECRQTFRYSRRQTARILYTKDTVVVAEMMTE